MKTQTRIVGVLICAIFIGLCTASDASAAALTITGSVISGPPGNSKPVRKSTVTLYQAAVQGFPVFNVHSVKTNAHGNFTMRFKNKPQAGAVLYFVARGGNAGGGTNTAIELIAILGEAPFPKRSFKATVNELTTVAAAYVLSNFINTAFPLYPQCFIAETNICDNFPDFP